MTDPVVPLKISQTGDTVRLIYAYGLSDPAGGALGYSDYHHSGRGVRSVYLLEPARPVPTERADDLVTFDMLCPEV